jgi:hypothetical protein
VDDNCLVLEAKSDLSVDYLFYISFCIRAQKWRYRYGRQITPQRLGELEVVQPEDFKTGIPFDEFKKIIYPRKNNIHETKINIKWKSFVISQLFDLKSGDYHNADDLPTGSIPLVSCGETDDGIMKFVKVPKEDIYKDTLTIAFNGQPLTTNYRPYEFAAKDDVAVCINKRNFGQEVLLFAKMMIERETWRYSYGRKCFREKLLNVNIQMPIKGNGEIDENIIKAIFVNTAYWKEFSERSLKYE